MSRLLSDLTPAVLPQEFASGMAPGLAPGPSATLPQGLSMEIIIARAFPLFDPRITYSGAHSYAISSLPMCKPSFMRSRGIMRMRNFTLLSALRRVICSVRIMRAANAYIYKKADVILWWLQWQWQLFRWWACSSALHVSSSCTSTALRPEPLIRQPRRRRRRPTRKLTAP